MTARETYDSLFASLSERDTVYPSKIGEQFYCEKKIELAEEYGEVETPEVQRGTKTHEKAAEDAIEVEKDEMWDAIERGDRQIIVETSFVGEAAEFVILGKPDAIVFENNKPQLIFDRKTTSIPERVFDNQRIQVWIYGYMLRSLGFDVDELQLAILTHEQQLDDETGKRLQQKILNDVIEVNDGKTRLTENPDSFLYLSEYDPIGYLTEFQWAMEYWQGEREPEPTDNVAKCRSCPYEDACPDSLLS